MRFATLGLTVVVGLAAAGGALAADAPMTLQVVPPPMVEEGWHPYVKLYGGYLPAQKINFVDVDQDMDAGWLLGGAIGAEVMDGISVEIDGTYSTADFTGPLAEGINAATLMANVVLTGALTDEIAVYGGVGLGGVGTQYYEDPDSDWAYGAGGQIFAGLSYSVAENVSIFGEARYQAAFDTITMDHDGHTDDIAFTRYSLLAGVKFGW